VEVHKSLLCFTAIIKHNRLARKKLDKFRNCSLKKLYNTFYGRDIKCSLALACLVTECNMYLILLYTT